VSTSVRQTRRPLSVIGLSVAATVVISSLVAAPAQAVKTPSCSTNYTAAHAKTCIRIASAAFTSAWKSSLTKHNKSTKKAHIVAWTAFPTNPCISSGEGDVAVASFYCDKNRTVYMAAGAAKYWTKTYAKYTKKSIVKKDAKAAHVTLATMKKGYATQGYATELAHEYGHAMQDRLGVFDFYQNKINETSTWEEQTALAAGIEVGADCLAGWSLSRASVRGKLRMTQFAKWASRATIAELGAGVATNYPFIYPMEEPSPQGHSNSYWRLKSFNYGMSIGKTRADGMAGCVNKVASWANIPVPPGF